MKESSEILVVVGICYRDGLVLMGRRRTQESQYPEYWEFPGGKVEKEENPIEALDREFHEELGCRIRSAELFKEKSWESSRGLVYRLCFYLVRLSCEEVPKFRLSAHSKLEWYSIPNALKEEILPANREILEELASRATH